MFKSQKVAYLIASATATAQATVAPTIGLLPNPKIIFVFMYLCLIVSSETLAITEFQSSLFEFCIFLCFAVFCCILANIFHFDEYLTNLSRRLMTKNIKGHYSILRCLYFFCFYYFCVCNRKCVINIKAVLNICYKPY